MPHNFVRSFVRSCSVNYTQNIKSVKQLNDSDCTNSLRKKASALRLCRIFFAAEPCSRSAFLFLRSLVFRFTRKNTQLCRYGNCTSVCNSQLKFAPQTRLCMAFPASMPELTLFPNFSHNTHRADVPSPCVFYFHRLLVQLLSSAKADIPTEKEVCLKSALPCALFNPSFCKS